MTQLALPFVWPPDPSDDEFLLSDSNAAAAAHLRDWWRWPVPATLLTGPRKSGRTLLARLFVKGGGRAIDDADRQNETQLFHAWNAAQAEGVPLLLVADAAPPAWRVKLPDLRSRLGATPVARLGAPDDALMRALFERAFLKRGLDARPDLVQWLVARVERSHVALGRAVDALDTAALAERRRLSIPLARAALAAAGMLGGNDGSSDAR